MKKIFLTLALSLPVISSGAPCKGAPGKNHINSDNSVGGFIANTASASKSAYIDSSSSVCEKATVQGNAQVRNGSEVSGSAVIEGNAYLNSSKVKGIAKVFGGAVVTNSFVCQASLINFNVNGSDYYCQTEDEEPKDPGELGKKTVLGIDSNVNGIRDDVEIWINNTATNTPNKDMYNVRMALKQIAKGIQQNVKMKDNREESIKVGRTTQDDFKCLKDILTPAEYEALGGDLQVEVYNTMDRLKVWAKLQGNLSGQSFKIEDSKKRSTCSFRLR